MHAVKDDYIEIYSPFIPAFLLAIFALVAEWARAGSFGQAVASVPNGLDFIWVLHIMVLLSFCMAGSTFFDRYQHKSDTCIFGSQGGINRALFGPALILLAPLYGLRVIAKLIAGFHRILAFFLNRSARDLIGYSLFNKPDSLNRAACNRVMQWVRNPSQDEAARIAENARLEPGKKLARAYDKAELSKADRAFRNAAFRLFAEREEANPLNYQAQFEEALRFCLLSHRVTPPEHFTGNIMNGLKGSSLSLDAAGIIPKR
jgi:hypothetical protein